MMSDSPVLVCACGWGLAIPLGWAEQAGAALALHLRTAHPAWLVHLDGEDLDPYDDDDDGPLLAGCCEGCCDH